MDGDPAGFRRARDAAALAGIVGLAVAVLGYYGYAVLLGDRAALSVAAVSDSIRFWLIAAVVLGPGLGLVGAGIRRRDLTGVVAACVLPLGTLTEMLLLPTLDPYDFATDRWVLLARHGLVVLAGLGALTAVVRWLILGSRPHHGPADGPAPPTRPTRQARSASATA